MIKKIQSPFGDNNSDGLLFFPATSVLEDNMNHAQMRLKQRHGIRANIKMLKKLSYRSKRVVNAGGGRFVGNGCYRVYLSVNKKMIPLIYSYNQNMIKTALPV